MSDDAFYSGINQRICVALRGGVWKGADGVEGMRKGNESLAMSEGDKEVSQ